MAHFYVYIILALFIGGLAGWTLFVFTLKYFLSIKYTQILMIEDIRKDIVTIKSEIQQLK